MENIFERLLEAKKWWRLLAEKEQKSLKEKYFPFNEIITDSEILKIHLQSKHGKQS